MIRRPLNERFAEMVLAGIKTTTIRDTAWPVGVPIMLFRWSDKPYRSKQVEIAPVVVIESELIYLTARKLGLPTVWFHDADGLDMCRNDLEKSEGFGSMAEMDDWFLPLLKTGQTVTKALMRFRLLERGAA